MYGSHTILCNSSFILLFQYFETMEKNIQRPNQFDELPQKSGADILMPINQKFCAHSLQADLAVTEHVKDYVRFCTER